MTTLRLQDLDPRVRTALLVAAGAEAGLKIAALIDLAQRAPGTVTGSRRRWAFGIVTVNSLGLLPVLYFLRGRR